MQRKYNKQPKTHVRKGDTVQVLAGNDKGKTASVLQVFPQQGRAIVEGINMVTKHTKPSAQKPEGSRENVEASIHLSNLMLINPADGKPTRTGRRRNDKGKLQRYSKKTGEFI